MGECPIFLALEAGTTVVTGNDRLARHQLERYAERHLQAGQLAWIRPKLLSWQAFLNELADHWLFDRADSPKRLSTAAATALWEKLVRDASPVPILQPGATARSLQDAWNSLHAVMLDETLLRPETLDCRAFVDWAGRFRRYCEAAGFVDAARIPDLLSQQLSRKESPNPGRIVLTGFLELTPQQQNFLAAWEAAGGEWRRVDPVHDLPHGDIKVAGFVDSEQECIAAARWARDLLSSNPSARIGIVAHDLEARRALIRRHLIRQLLPTSRLAEVIDNPPFNFSMGRPLCEYAMIRDALIILSLGERIDYRDAGRLLRSPFLGDDAQQRSSYLQLGKAIRDSGRHTFNIGFLASLAAQHASVFAGKLERFQTLRANQPSRQRAERWAHCFSDELKLLGWSQGRTLSSDENQLREAWYGILGGFSGLDTILQKMDRTTALSQLSRLAAERVFQARTGTAPVQVLGLLEAIGLQFDHLWVMGLTDNTWPQPARPNPFLPIKMQREHHMPHASAEREREFATNLMRLLERSAPDVIFSYPQSEQDRVLRISPLLAGLPQQDYAVDSVDPLTVRMIGSATLESFKDDVAPALRSEELEHGGTSVVTDMAACPFKAFAKTRLHAKEELFPDSGLNAAERGDLLHALLKNVWDELQTQTHLLQLSETQREDLVLRHTRKLLRKRYGSESQHSETFLETEKQRLHRLVMQWLAVEASRPAFQVIGTEIPVKLEIGSLSLRGRIDRIDETDSGGQILIDYKTAAQLSITDWVGERPTQPQMPLYAVTREQFPAAVAFARTRTGSCQFEGLAKEEGVLENVKAFKNWKERPDGVEKWTDLAKYWRLNLTELGRRFAEGDAAVDPKVLNKTCKYCHLSVLCRIDERSQSRRGFSGDPDDE
ncbi:MAG: PD-(D/E)XK nuclease family protein [Gammaproteobacteria bacterium]